MLEIEGVVASGLGEGRVFTQIEWAAKQFRAKLGFIPYPGTLNLVVAGEAWQRARTVLARSPGIAIVPPDGCCGARCFMVNLGDRIRAAAVLPDVPDYPTDKLEILAPLALRRELGVKDGDRLKVVVALAAHGHASMLSKEM